MEQTCFDLNFQKDPLILSMVPERETEIEQ
jgi:hypothetical protein